MNLGINYCVNCIGLHPHEIVTRNEIANRMLNHQKYIAAKLASFENWKHTYKNKSCILCGRTYDENGNLDNTWDMTARRVKAEFDNAGIFGVSDDQIRKVVASCRQSFLTLISKRNEIQPQFWERFTFQGRLALIITSAQEARKKKVQGL